MIFRLCYVEDGKAWFTSNWKEQWGDDWGDVPYEHNAGTPYHSYYGDGPEEIPIELRELYFEIPWLTKEPNYGFLNSPFSVEAINSKRCPWLTIEYGDKTQYIFAGTTYNAFIKIIESLGGVVYTPRRRNK